LRALGIDAVWIPPTVKNSNATGSVGYAPFDPYDLGDKFQCGSTTTRFGTKDAYLRMVAVLHANGIDVLQDMVWNHLNGAGSEAGGAGGQDPAAWGSSAYKNFRYVCYATPAGTGSAADYGSNGGGYDLVGSFDFSLRGALKNMVSSSGSFDLGSLPATQQIRRSRTAPFVNNHDTFRPVLSSSGNYIGWDSADELGGHVDPFDSRIQAAYAAALA